MRLDLGSPVRCADGDYGELADVVIDPQTRRVTHLVVAPPKRHDLARLVPIARAAAAPDDAIVLEWTRADLEALEPLQKSAYLRLGDAPVEDPEWQVGISDLMALPYYGSFAPQGFGAGTAPLGIEENVTEVYDRIPKDEIEIRRASAVISSDDHLLGHVDGFVVDERELISHFVLQRGHLWGKREVTIPVGAVAEIRNDELTLNLSKSAVGELESVPVHRWPG